MPEVSIKRVAGRGRERRAGNLVATRLTAEGRVRVSRPGLLTISERESLRSFHGINHRCPNIHDMSIGSVLFADGTNTGTRFGTEHAPAIVQFSEWNRRMSASPIKRTSYVMAVDGGPLVLSDLPGPNHKRWVIRHKANLVAAVRGGLISLEDACKRYDLSTDEFLSWQRLFERFGMLGLRTTRSQQYRDRNS
jgi:hypothetical protein